jgi:hypothetical protein
MAHGGSGYGMTRHRKARRGSLSSKRCYRLEPPVLEFEAAILELARQRRHRPKKPHHHQAKSALMRQPLEKLELPPR